MSAAYLRWFAIASVTWIFGTAAISGLYSAFDSQIYCRSIADDFSACLSALREWIAQVDLVERFQLLFPAHDLGDDGIGWGSPGEGFGVYIVSIDVFADGLVEVENGMEDAAF